MTGLSAFMSPLRFVMWGVAAPWLLARIVSRFWPALQSLWKRGSLSLQQLLHSKALKAKPSGGAQQSAGEA